MLEVGVQPSESTFERRKLTSSHFTTTIDPLEFVCVSAGTQSDADRLEMLQKLRDDKRNAG
jgi:hypothetical protein